MNKTELADKIRILRKGLGLRQDELAGKAGVSIRVIRDLEGASGNPTIESLNLVCTVLGISLSEILMPGVKPSNIEIVNRPWSVGGESPDNKDQETNSGFPVRTISKPGTDTQRNEERGRKSGKPPHKMSEKVDNFIHTPQSEQNQKNFSSEELRLIVAIQMRLPTLNEEQLETVLLFVNNIQAATRTDSVKIAKE